MTLSPPPLETAAPFAAAVRAAPRGRTEAGIVLERARGRAEVGFKAEAGVTRLERMFQQGQAKIRLPRVYGADLATAVLINSAGGVTGGDRLDYAVAWGADTAATVTSQAAERIYRSGGGDGRISTALSVGAGACAEWLPQETILFQGSRLVRRLEVEVAASARLLMVETVVFGRTAMGESVTDVRLADHWRIRRDGRLIHADTLRLDGDAVSILAGPATGGGALATATIVYVGAEAEAEAVRMRAILEAPADPVDAIDDDAPAARRPDPSFASEIGVSTWNGVMIVRMIAGSARLLRLDLVRILEAFRGRPLPRAWSC